MFFIHSLLRVSISVFNAEAIWELFSTVNMSFCSGEFTYLNKFICKNEANLKGNIFLRY